MKIPGKFVYTYPDEWGIIKDNFIKTKLILR